ncbi:MAG: hypothetical protein GX808_07735 [Syntrophomonadaceae bacterium]|nr:hypothetical protein [Syntrophomonadaceae bacterium]
MTGFIFAVIAIIVLTPWILKKLSAGKWEITVLQVINNWRSLKGADSNLTDSDLFIRVLDNRYDKFKDLGGEQQQLFHDKEKYKNSFTSKIRVGKGDYKYNISTAAMACLFIEKHSIIQRHSEDELLDIIRFFVQSQGVSEE